MCDRANSPDTAPNFSLPAEGLPKHKGFTTLPGRVRAQAMTMMELFP